MFLFRDFGLGNQGHENKYKKANKGRKGRETWEEKQKSAKIPYLAAWMSNFTRQALSTVIVKQVSEILEQKLVTEKSCNAFQSDISFPKILQAAIQI